MGQNTPSLPTYLPTSPEKASCLARHLAWEAMDGELVSRTNLVGRWFPRSNAGPTWDRSRLWKHWDLSKLNLDIQSLSKAHKQHQATLPSETNLTLRYCNQMRQWRIVLLQLLLPLKSPSIDGGFPSSQGMKSLSIWPISRSKSCRKVVPSSLSTQPWQWHQGWNRVWLIRTITHTLLLTNTKGQDAYVHV